MRAAGPVVGVDLNDGHLAVRRLDACGNPAAHGIRLYAVNPAYTSAWGDQHWRKPYLNVTRHEAAATVIGRRAQGHKARRTGKV
jgi:hypothetical protein